MDLLQFLRAKLRSGAAIIALAALSLIGVRMHGNQEYQAQGLVMVFCRLNLLLLWAWFAGWMLDLANGVKFENDLEAIRAGNVAVSLSRTVGYAALVIAGAMLIQRL